MSIRSTLRAGQSGLVSALRWVSAPLRGIWPRFPEAVMGLVALAIIGLGMLTYSPSLVCSASNSVSGDKYTALLDGMLTPLRSRHGLTQPDVPLYDLKIAKNHLRAIDAMIEKAKQQGYMTDDR